MFSSCRKFLMHRVKLHFITPPLTVQLRLGETSTATPLCYVKLLWVKSKTSVKKTPLSFKQN